MMSGRVPGRIPYEKDLPVKMWLQFVKNPHFKASVSGFLIGITLPNFGNIWNDISSSIWIQKYASTERDSY